MLFDFRQARYNNAVVKVTGLCNLRCKYCYTREQAVKEPMNKEVLAALFREYARYAQQLEKNRRFTYFVWHGGEPFTCGLDYFKQLLEMQKRVFGEAQCEAWNGIQTNGTLITEEWLDWLHLNQFSVGISIDGPRAIHDINRVGSGTKTVFSAIDGAIKRLKGRAMEFNVSAVVSDDIVPYAREIYEYLQNVGARYVEFIPCFDLINPRKTLSQQGFENFYLSILEIWLEAEPEERAEIRLFSDFIKRLTNRGIDNILGCETMGQCGEIQYIIENGDLYPCTVLPIIDKLRMGNIVRDGLKACLSSDNYNRFQAMYNENCGCEVCDLLDICRGGCASRRLYGRGKSGAQSRDLYCVGRRKIIARIIEHLRGGK